MQKELYNKFASKMYAVCLRYADNSDDAKDLLQEGFIKIYKNLNRFRSEAHLKDGFAGYLLIQLSSIIVVNSIFLLLVRGKMQHLQMAPSPHFKDLMKKTLLN